MSSGKVKQAIIMVGGMGTRLRPLTNSRPKPILPVLDRPCLSYLVESFSKAGITEIILACGYRSEQMSEAIGDGSEWGISIEYSYEDEPMGTAGAIKLLEDRLDETFVMAFGDVFADMNLTEEIEEHFSSGADVTFALTPVPNPCEFGIARVDESGRITEFKEKPLPEEVFSDLISAGVFVMNRDLLSLVPSGRPFDFSKELMPLVMSTGRTVQSHILEGVWKDVGRPSDLLAVNMVMASRRFGDYAWPQSSVPGSSIIKPFYLGQGASAKDSAMSAVVLSEGCTVVGGKISNSLLFKGCSVEGAEISNSILGEGCTVGTGAVIISSVLGDGTVVEAGARVEGENR
jgi:mannose-1-phosphate guanylyltransferase